MTEKPSTATQETLQWTQNHLGRDVALVANEVYGVTNNVTRVVGWTVGDPKLQLKSARRLSPIHLQMSARVHHVAFFHPSLDPSATMKKPASSPTSSGNGEIDTGLPLGLQVGGGPDAEAATIAAMAARIEAEHRRLSRDGIVEDHMKRKRNKTKSKKHPTGSQSPLKGARRFMMLSTSDPNEQRGTFGHHRSKSLANRIVTGLAAIGPPSSTEGKRAGIQTKYLKGFKEAEDARTHKRNSSAFSKSGADRAAALHAVPEATHETHPLFLSSEEPSDVDVFDEDDVTGSGCAFASIVMDMEVARIGRYLPEVACRVPRSSISFEVKNSSRVMSSTQPFVVEAPHVIWGQGRDRLLRTVAEEGNPLVDARPFEYLTNCELRWVGFSESLLLIPSTVWVDIAPEIKEYEKTPSSVLKDVKGGIIKTTKGITKMEKKVGKQMGKGARAIGKAMHLPGSPKKEKSDKGAESGSEAEVRSGAEDIAGDSGSAGYTSAASEDTEKKKLSARKVFGKAAKALHVVGKKTSKTPTKDTEAAFQHDETLGRTSSRFSGDVSVASDLTGEASTFSDHEMETQVPKVNENSSILYTARDINTGGNEGDVASSKGAQPASSIEQENNKTEKNQKQQVPTIEPSVIEDPKPYVLVLDDVINFRVTGFPSEEVLATFPISVASVLNERGIEERLANPRRPSELNVTLVQEPSIHDEKWGVEVNVTFRVRQVMPKTDLELDPPDLDDNGNRIDWNRQLQDMKENLMQMGQSKEESERRVNALLAKKRADEEAWDAAIVAAGTGKGYEHGAPNSEIRLRQIFHDPECAAFSNAKRRREVDPGDISKDAAKTYGERSLAKNIANLKMEFPSIDDEDEEETEEAEPCPSSRVGSFKDNKSKLSYNTLKSPGASEDFFFSAKQSKTPSMAMGKVAPVQKSNTPIDDALPAEEPGVFGPTEKVPPSTNSILLDEEKENCQSSKTISAPLVAGDVEDMFTLAKDSPEDLAKLEVDSVGLKGNSTTKVAAEPRDDSLSAGIPVSSEGSTTDASALEENSAKESRVFPSARTTVPSKPGEEGSNRDAIESSKALSELVTEQVDVCDESTLVENLKQEADDSKKASSKEFDLEEAAQDISPFLPDRMTEITAESLGEQESFNETQEAENSSRSGKKRPAEALGSKGNSLKGSLSSLYTQKGISSISMEKPAAEPDESRPAPRGEREIASSRYPHGAEASLTSTSAPGENEVDDVMPTQTSDQNDASKGGPSRLKSLVRDSTKGDGDNIILDHQPPDEVERVSSLAKMSLVSAGEASSVVDDSVPDVAADMDEFFRHKRRTTLLLSPQYVEQSTRFSSYRARAEPDAVAHTFSGSKFGSESRSLLTKTPFWAEIDASFRSSLLKNSSNHGNRLEVLRSINTARTELSPHNDSKQKSGDRSRTLSNSLSQVVGDMQKHPKRFLHDISERILAALKAVLKILLEEYPGTLVGVLIFWIILKLCERSNGVNFSVNVSLNK